MANNRTIIPALLASILLVALPGIQCNKASCEDLRDELHAQKLVWQACESDLDCVIVGGSTRDCSGIMSCNFAVHRKFRGDAERRIASLPEETQDCFECASPNCESGELPHCEPVSGRCLVVTRLVEVDGGSTIGGGFVPPAGGAGRNNGDVGGSGNAGTGGSGGVGGGANLAGAGI